MSNKQFKEILDKYKYLCDKWYRTVSYRVKIDKDTFKSEFYYILFKAVLRFKVSENGNYDSSFENYLNASLKKLTTTFKRKAMTLKYKTEKRQVTFCPISHNVTDERHIPLDKDVEIRDMLLFCKKEVKDKGFSSLRYSGYSVEEACEKLHISTRQYKDISKRIKDHSEIKKAFEGI